MESWFSKRLFKWYKNNKRDLPWRNQTDAYKIWLSEIILQQTQVVQGTSYYLKFIKTFPKITHLADADEDMVLKLWQGLGYYSRARNLHTTAKVIKDKYNGVFPSDYSQILALKGVGDYTAAAIASFAFGLPYAVVDGNVFRVLSRLFGIETPIDTGIGKKEFYQLATELLDKKDPATHNQAIMEFGSQFCKPNNPDCDVCIFKLNCFAFKSNKVKELPIKSKKIKIHTRYLNYFVLIDKKNKVIVNKRSENDIWKGLYEFFMIESDGVPEINYLLENTQLKKIIGQKATVLFTSKLYKHVLSHQHLFARFFVIKINAVHSKIYLQTHINNVTDFAFAKLTEKFFNDFDLKEIV